MTETSDLGKFAERVLNTPAREPDFENLLAVLRRERPSRPTLYEFFMNGPLYARLIGRSIPNSQADPLGCSLAQMAAYARAGYDYYMMHPYCMGFRFTHEEHAQGASISLNEGASISDRASFEAYPWPDPDAADYDLLAAVAKQLPGKMKLIPFGADGQMENLVRLVGYENLCMMLIDDPELVQAIADEVGRRLLRYYQRCLEHPGVGAIMCNDDWGFKTQTSLAPADMRKYVIPWHQKFVAAAHDAGKPALIHSCGKLDEVMDDIIDVIGFDGKHSYEDTILPVEQAYDRWGGRIAILGGMDVDFVCRRAPQEVFDRSLAMLEKTADKGGYALGTGNSVPTYVPQENYFAMIAAALCPEG